MVYLCDECGEQFSKAWSLERHMHENHKLENDTQNNVKVFSCTKCNFVTDTDDQLTEHKRKHIKAIIIKSSHPEIIIE